MPRLKAIVTPRLLNGYFRIQRFAGGLKEENQETASNLCSRLFGVQAHVSCPIHSQHQVKQNRIERTFFIVGAGKTVLMLVHNP